MHSIMASLNLGQDVANKREKMGISGHIVAKPYPLQQVVIIRRYGSLINSNPSGKEEIFFSPIIFRCELEKRIVKWIN